MGGLVGDGRGGYSTWPITGNWFVCHRGRGWWRAASSERSWNFVIRWRFFDAPRLMVMVVTIGLAQLLGGIQLLVPGWLGGPSIVGGGDHAAAAPGTC